MYLLGFTFTPDIPKSNHIYLPIKTFMAFAKCKTKIPIL